MKAPFLKIELITFLLLFTAACASTKKKAQENLEAGSFDSAVQLFEEVLQKDPNDVEAQTGLRQARDGSIDKTLIEVRMSRLASNPQNATDLLMSVLEKEHNWHFSPRANVAFTQNEETQMAAEYIQSKVQTSIQSNRPFQAEHFLVKYRRIFQAPPEKAHYQQLFKGVVDSGKKTCESFQRIHGKSTPYFADFLNRLCSHYEASCKTCFTWSQGKLHELYGMPDVSSTIVDLPQEFVPLMQNNFQSTFRETPWYDAKGVNKTSFLLTGIYKFSHQKNLVNLIQNYTAEEPFQTVEMVSVPKEVSTQTWNPSTGTYTTTTHTEYRSEPQTVTRYRTVDKTFPYSALKHQLNFDFSVNADTHLAGQSFHSSFQENFAQEGYEHNLDVPEVGLKPSVPQLTNAADWIKSESGKLNRQLKDKLQTEWISDFCKTDSSTSNADIWADRVQKCVRASTAQNSKFVQEWYENQLGVNFQTAEELLSGSDSKRLG